MTQVRGGSVRVTIAGAAFELDADAVVAQATAVLPDPLNDHYVVISGRRYPPKQVVALVTGLDRADFTTHQARRILRRLGFAVGRKSSSFASPAPAQAGPHLGAEADALRPHAGKWVAQKGIEVLVAADTPREVFDWLHRHDVHADGMFKVPERPGETEGAGPF